VEFAEQGGEKLNFGQQLMLLRELRVKRELEEEARKHARRARKSRANEFKKAASGDHDNLASSMESSEEDNSEEEDKKTWKECFRNCFRRS